MTTFDSLLNFHADSLTITYKDRVIVDLSNVPKSAKARIYSGYTSDTTGIKTPFNVIDSEQPFDLGFTLLSLQSFLYILVENRLELDGMSVEDDFIEAYCHIIDRHWLSKKLYESRIIPSPMYS
ncbi:hypothetical protein [Desulfopila sp. IMCC35008]|uniref:hypothetical protein n=1 Tax=Desulfopila sp. IMCC35008 TaxID=2653858 RepID=UPI0013D3F5F5|nr:hypothetical protein [Desulfopila sp. IMCC35008]